MWLQGYNFRPQASEIHILSFSHDERLPIHRCERSEPLPLFSRGVGQLVHVNAHESVAGRSSYSLSTTFIMQTAEWQTPPDADVILRTSVGKEFHAHKLILSLASPAFRDMFSVPQPPSTSQLPIIDIDDPPEALKAFLQIIYPAHNPLINNVETLASVIRLADKYDARAVLGVHKDYLPSTSPDFPPIQTYAILCACGREEEAGAVARRVPFASLKTLDSNPLLQFITTTQYQRLVSFMTARDQRMRQIVSRHHQDIAHGLYALCKSDTSHSLYSSTIVLALQTAFEADPCVQVAEALGFVLGAPCSFTQCGDRCRYNVTGLRGYAEGLLRELVGMAQSLSWDNPHKVDKAIHYDD